MSSQPANQPDIPTNRQNNNQTLRRQLRRQRLALTLRERQYASYQTIRQLRPIADYFRQTQSQRPCKVGVFIDAFGELPTQPLIDWAIRYGFEIYLPVVTGMDKPLYFVKLPSKNSRNARLIRHSLGMQQPASGQRLHVNQLNILFMPLVAFDKDGYRMGMGGGFYDRTLAKTKTKPLKIGYAYDFQQVEKLTVNAWDVRLDMAVTPSKLYRFQRYLIPTSVEKPLETDELDEQVIAHVMNPERLAQLLAQAEMFSLVNSEALDEF